MFDSKCYDLAEQFLADTAAKGNAALTANLAQQIQDCIEDFIKYEIEDRDR